MKKCLFSLLLSLAALPVAAQIEETFWHWQVIDTARIVCSYDYTEYFMFRSKHIKTHDDLWLEIGDHLSKFERLVFRHRPCRVSDQNSIGFIHRCSTG